MGTYSICALASVSNVPVYCVCETFKFVRKFMLGKKDLEEYQRTVPFKAIGTDEELDAFAYDYTPAKFVYLLLTDRGPMPPSAVTYELTQLLGVS